MSVTTTDIFGAATAAEPADPGSYGEAPAGYRLPGATQLGRVRLQIADLGRSLEFYERTLGLRRLERGKSDALLSAHDDERVLVELVEGQNLRPAGKGLFGLYHFAILLPDRASLGRFVGHLAATGKRAGGSDHLVSEAFYLRDPDGLGIEVYADRPRATWRRMGRELMIATDPVDVAQLVRAGGDAPWNGMPAGTVIGHVHLHVGDLSLGARFFSEALGFDRMTGRYPGALFMGAGGYHHHLGTNTWAGSGARPPDEGDARLLEWTIALPTAADVAAAARSIDRAGYRVETTAGEALAHDPWGTPVRLRLAGGPGAAP